MCIQRQIAYSFMSTWTVYEWMCTTVRNFGHSSRRLHFFYDESYLDSTEATMSEYYGTDPDLLDPYHVGRYDIFGMSDRKKSTIS